MPAIAAAVLCAVAAFSGLAAFASSVGRLAPQLSMGVWPPDGTVFSAASNVELAQAMAGVKSPTQTLPKDLPQSVASLSRRALKLEPTDSVAARNLAFFFASRGDAKKAAALMEATYRLSRRDAGLNLWLIEDRARRGDEAGALELYDITIRTSTSAAGLLMDRMAATLDQPGAVPLFERLLARNPPWIDQFWTAVLSGESEQERLEASYRLRQALHADGVKMARSHDALLIQRLADAGLISQAFALYKAVGGRSPAGGELLVDGDFEHSSEFAPIGWKMPVAMTFGANLDKATGKLAIAALPNANGIVVQQIVPIESGSYALTVQYGDDAAAADRRFPMSLRMVCALNGGQASLNREFPLLQSGVTRFDLKTNCPFAWVSLVLKDAGDSQGLDLAIDRLSLKRTD